MQRDDVLRGVKVTGIVALLGAVGGALGGALIGVVLGIAALIFDGVPDKELDLLSGIGVISAMSAVVGAGYGTVLGPLYSWTLLRRVALWRAIIEPAIVAAITVGAVLALLVPSVWLLYGAPVLTSALAAVRLRRATNRTLAAGGEERLLPS